MPQQHLDLATIPEKQKMQNELKQTGILFYLCGKRTRMLRFVTVLNIRNVACPAFPGGETLAASSPRAK
jgi:hypothetical protein